MLGINKAVLVTDLERAGGNIGEAGRLLLRRGAAGAGHQHTGCRCRQRRQIEACFHFQGVKRIPAPTFYRWAVGKLSGWRPETKGYIRKTARAAVWVPGRKPWRPTRSDFVIGPGSAWQSLPAGLLGFSWAAFLSFFLLLCSNRLDSFSGALFLPLRASAVSDAPLKRMRAVFTGCAFFLLRPRASWFR